MISESEGDGQVFNTSKFSDLQKLLYMAGQTPINEETDENSTSKVVTEMATEIQSRRHDDVIEKFDDAHS